MPSSKYSDGSPSGSASSSTLTSPFPLPGTPSDESALVLIAPSHHDPQPPASSETDAIAESTTGLMESLLETSNKRSVVTLDHLAECTSADIDHGTNSENAPDSSRLKRVKLEHERTTFEACAGSLSEPTGVSSTPSSDPFTEPPTHFLAPPFALAVPQRRAARDAQARLNNTIAKEPEGQSDGGRPTSAKASRRSTGSSAPKKPSRNDLIQANRFVQDGTLWEVQFAGCKIKAYQQWPSCVACISKATGDMCRFIGLRAFAVDQESGEVYTPNDTSNVRSPVLLSSRKPDQRLDLPVRDSYHRIMDGTTFVRLQRTVSQNLLPTLRREVDHAKLANVLRRERETSCRQMCEFCNTSIFSASWLCRSCGREYCCDCKVAIESASEALNNTSKRLHKLILCSRMKGHDVRYHGITDLVPLTRFSLDVLEEEIAIMEELRLMQPESQGAPSDIEQRPKADLITPQEATGKAGDVEIDWTSLPPLEAGITADDVVGSLSLRRFESTAMDNDLMEREWRCGEPLLVTDVLRSMRNRWDPAAFIERYGGQECHIIRCDEDSTKEGRAHAAPKLVTVSAFFATFGTSQEERDRKLGKGSWKLKDWPPSSDFHKTFPELYEDFNLAVPVPDYTRRGGVLNLASCYPPDVIQPDLGPKMYNAWPSSEGPGSKGTTRLHMDMADAVNIMLYARAPEVDGLPEVQQPGVAAWDIFRAEDADKIRKFLREELDPQGDFKDDPIHTQRYFIDAELRVKLFQRYGVRGWRIYQQQGEAVFIPAGCAHQVCNLADCIKVAVDFVSPENVARCFQLTSEFRELTNDQKAWKEDVLSLRTTLWYAWCTYRQLQGAGPNADAVDRSRPATERVKMVPQIPSFAAAAASTKAEPSKTVSRIGRSKPTQNYFVKEDSSQPSEEDEDEAMAVKSEEAEEEEEEEAVRPRKKVKKSSNKTAKARRQQAREPEDSTYSDEDGRHDSENDVRRKVPRSRRKSDRGEGSLAADGAGPASRRTANRKKPQSRRSNGTDVDVSERIDIPWEKMMNYASLEATYVRARREIKRRGLELPEDEEE